MCLVTLIDIDGSTVKFGFQAGSTVADVLTAHAQLTGPLQVQLISNDRGHFLPFNQQIEPGQCIQVFLSKTDEGELFAGASKKSGDDCGDLASTLRDVSMEPACGVSDSPQAPGPPVCLPKSESHGVVLDKSLHFPGDQIEDVIKTVDLGVKTSEGLVSPTAIWTVPCKAESEDSDVNLRTLSAPSLWGSIQASFGLSQQQFLKLSVPCVGDPAKLLALRSQVITPNERLQLLEAQHGLWADDEIAFHLQLLADQFCRLPRVIESGKARICLIDPLLMSAWICGCGFPIDIWAKDHPEIRQFGIQVIGVGRLESHWIPFQFVPCGAHANVFTWDSPSVSHDRFNQVLEYMGKALGFNSVLISRQQRLFPVSTKCGAMAIHFLHGALHGTMLPIVASEVDMVHSMLRKRFQAALGQTGTAQRPWIWGNGDVDDDERGCPAVSSGECGLLPRMPTTPACAVIESLTREARTAVSDEVTFHPTLAAMRVGDLHMSPVNSFPDPHDTMPEASDSVQVSVLVQMDCQRMRNLDPPIIASLTRLGELRSQLISVHDRIALLVRQFGIWADDELRFHLHELAAVCSAGGMIDGDLQRPVVIDPLRFSSWFDERSMTCTQWALTQHDVWITQSKVFGVFKWDHHWFPVLFLPEGDHVTIMLSHKQLQIPARLVNILVDIATAFGFGGIRFHHEIPNFVCYSACGASAIDFLRHKLLGTPISTAYAQVWQVHSFLRERFRQALLLETLVSRPWVWASGDSDEDTEKEWHSDDENCTGDAAASSSLALPAAALPMLPPASHSCIATEARIELFAQHGKEMGDDEIRFHLTSLLKQRESRILVDHELLPLVLGFESLNFMNWDEVGHILTEKWCQGFPKFKEQAQQIVAVVLEGDHWLPLWCVPGGMILVVHTFDDVVDYDIFDGKLRWLGLHLGFEEVVIHRIPNGLPSHTMCGAHALAFLAHVLLGVALPEDLDELDTMRVNMRASFVQAMYERRTCFCPVIWGSGGTGALLKSLSEELCNHGVPTNLAEQRASQAIKAIGSEQLQQALQQKQVWRHLKALATNVSFKLVLPSELEASIASNRGKRLVRKTSVGPRFLGFLLLWTLIPVA